jgi:hypothetical protein
MGLPNTCFAMRSEIENRLSQLSRMSKPQLLALWPQLFRIPLLPKLRRDLLVRLLAYRIQERTHGGPAESTRKRLKEFARQLEKDPKAELLEVPRIKSGTRLVRDWRGHPHSVTVVQNGYEYKGKRYSSLSEVARLIAGTRWSGPLFFGLKGKHAKRRMNEQ